MPKPSKTTTLAAKSKKPYKSHSRHNTPPDYTGGRFLTKNMNFDNSLTEIQVNGLSNSQLLTPMDKLYPYKLCRLAKASSIQKLWYCEYYAFDLAIGRLKRKRIALNQPTEQLRTKAYQKISEKINSLLQSGYAINVIAIKTNPEQPNTTTHNITKDTSILSAIAHWLQYVQGSLKPRSFQTYYSDMLNFSNYLKDAKLQSLQIQHFNKTHALQYLDHLTINQKLSNRRRNNLLGTVKTLFQFYLRRSAIPYNPFAGVARLPTQATKHRAFSDFQVQHLKHTIIQHEPALWPAVAFIYYVFIRPGHELRTLQVSDILDKTILIRAQNAKNSRSQHIMIPDPLQRIIEQYGLRSYPPHYYVFGKGGPSATIADKNYWYRKHVNALIIAQYNDQHHDFYSWKHTGVIALFKATQNIELIRNQCRHTNVTITTQYLRDLGCFIDYSEINKFAEI